MNPFARYRYINAEEIIKANIRPNNISEDASSLLNALKSITYIANSESQKATNLHRNVIQKLTPKSHTLEILKRLGYVVSRQGDYVYERASGNESITRENAANEFQLFYNDLKKIKAGTLKGFEEYIQNASNRPRSRTHSRHKDDDDDDYTVPEDKPRSSSSGSFRSSSPPRPHMPDFSTVQRNNEKTLETIRSFKESIVPKHRGSVVHSFIRRKLLFLLFQQNYPDSFEFGPEATDDGIDQRIVLLKQKDRNQNAGSVDEVYFECLIRTNFDQSNALEMLRDNRPNLIRPPEPDNSRGPTTTTMGDGIQCARHQWLLLNENAEENEDEQILIEAGDEWKNTMHVVTAIVQLRQPNNNRGADGDTFSRMHRLIFTELSKIVGPQSTFKIEALANALCEVSPSNLAYLKVADIRDILRSCSDTRIPDNFGDNLMRSLSMECPICSGSYPRSFMEEMYLCSHTCCLDCVKQYYRNAIKGIKDPKSLNRLTCFQEEHEITDDIKLNFFQHLGTKLNQWFTDERRILDLYQENLYIATRNSRDKKCGNPRCAGFFYVNNDNRIARARCPHCQFQQCEQCCRKWNDEHTNMTCEQYAEWLVDNDPDDPEVQLIRYLNSAGMVCPNEKCKAVYEYQAGGCEHFRCPACKTEFCRICSALFYNPEHNTICPRPNCGLRNTLHAHCFLNCFREIRDASVEEIIRLLTAHKINVPEELRQKPQATGPGCPVEGCSKAASVTCENRFCESCYKQFLCLFVWRNQIEPWELYTDANLRQKLTNVPVAVPANATRAAIIALARQHLTQFLGKPKKIERRR